MSQGIADPTIPHLRVCSPAGKVNANTSAVLELQRQVIVSATLHGDVVLAGLNAHGISLRRHIFVRMPSGEVGGEAPFVGKITLQFLSLYCR